MAEKRNSNTENTKFHIFSSAYFRSVVERAQYVNDGKKEIAFIGRSNVGKSSLINSLCSRRGLAMVSRDPGKTRTINYFAIQSRSMDKEGTGHRQDWYLVDLPGYGFARTSQKSKDSWSSFIAEYIKFSPGLVLLCLLIDLRHPGLPIDAKAYEWLQGLGLPIQIVCTKSDKLGTQEKQKNLREVERLFSGSGHPVAYSAISHNGRDDLLHIIEQYVCGDES
ncbi:MAG TPA: YihA family ribosome biogenesis GTP-binding protein [Veillonellaceae bacterium]|jgi:GTP-binding protein|nr:YihA family ribosome biogenesis GTP-binding protein [Veillonellaceae bacterium]